MTDTISNWQSRLPFSVAALASVALYSAGLHGPFLLDDSANLDPLKQWLDGRAGAIELVLGNSSGVLGRPLSMFSLWLTAATGGMHPFPFKLGNLLIHVLCGLVGWQMLRRLLDQDPRFAAKANLTAAILAALWLLHPINVSTVLYAVQRMAQLSTLFVLLAVWVYMLARRQLGDGDTRPATIKLFILFPLLLIAGLFSKENAAVAPALCLVIELAYFAHRPRPGKILPTFYALFLLLPAMAAITIMVVAPDKLFGLYATRDFTMLERLLSQPRALMEYLGLIFWPRGGMMGVYVDDFIASTSLLSPPYTLLAWIALLAITAGALLMRKQAPSLFAGWLFFLVAHSVESTILPLELYFEHRNYLPLFGILLATAGLLNWLLEHFIPARLRDPRIAMAGATIAAVAFATITWQQVQVWRSMDTIVAQAIAYRPGSLRAVLSQVTLDVKHANYDNAAQRLQTLIISDNPRHRRIGLLSLLTVDCLRGKLSSLTLLQKADSITVPSVTPIEIQAYAPVEVAAQTGSCAVLNDGVVADSLVGMLDRTNEQPATSRFKWQLRATAARMYVRAGRWQDAKAQARQAWIPGISDTAVGGMLVRILLHDGDKAGAQQTLDEVTAHVDASHRTASKEVLRLQSHINTLAD